MEICSFERLESTQKYLVEGLENGSLTPPIAIIATEQSGGIGSRNNSWSGGEGNFFASFAIPIESLPTDLPLASSSIYFAYLMKKVLLGLGENVWLKWPNDLYSDGNKIGGIITQKIGQNLLCGIGVNLKNYQNGFKALGSDIEAKKLLDLYLKELREGWSWLSIFKEYRVEFESSKGYSTHIYHNKTSLQNASLCEDGSLIIDGKRVYSLR